jgi:starvation-inducible DNA-binding protein
MAKETTAMDRRKARITTPTDLGDNARRDITGVLNALLADVFALYMKSKNLLAELRSDNQALIASMR